MIKIYEQTFQLNPMQIINKKFHNTNDTIEKTSKTATTVSKKKKNTRQINEIALRFFIHPDTCNCRTINIESDTRSVIYRLESVQTRRNVGGGHTRAPFPGIPGNLLTAGVHYGVRPAPTTYAV